LQYCEVSDIRTHTVFNTLHSYDFSFKWVVAYSRLYYREEPALCAPSHVSFDDTFMGSVIKYQRIHFVAVILAKSRLILNISPQFLSLLTKRYRHNGQPK